MKTATAILDDALGLPVDERARLVRILCESLEPGTATPLDETWDETWGPELRRRLEDARTGQVRTVPWEEAVSRARSRISDSE